MWTTSVLWISMLAALPAAERPGVLMSGSATTIDNVLVRFTTVAEPPSKEIRGIEGEISGVPDRLHRYVVDPVTRQCLGFDLYAVPEGRNRFRVTFAPLSLKAEEIGRGIVILQPTFPPPQIIENGDTIAIDLLVRPDGRSKIVEYIQVLSAVNPLEPRIQGEPRDFTLDDGPLQFSFEQPTKLMMNGQEVGQYGMTGRPGGTLWFSFPGRGRYILSLAPHDRFEKAGTIRDNAIVFQDGGDRFELRTSAPVLGAGKAWNLYLLHDASYPSRNPPQYGTDRLENLLRKK